MPFSAKMKYQSFAVTAVGIAHGTSTLARSRERPTILRDMTSAIRNPSTVSRHTVTTVKNSVTHTEDQKSDPTVPGGQLLIPEPQSCSSHLL